VLEFFVEIGAHGVGGLTALTISCGGLCSRWHSDGVVDSVLAKYDPWDWTLGLLAESWSWFYFSRTRNTKDGDERSIINDHEKSCTSVVMQGIGNLLLHRQLAVHKQSGPARANAIFFSFDSYCTSRFCLRTPIFCPKAQTLFSISGPTNNHAMLATQLATVSPSHLPLGLPPNAPAFIA